MATSAGRKVYVSFSGADLSGYSNNVTFGKGADTEDVTCFGDTAHTYAATLENATFNVSGIYDTSTTASPHVKLIPWVGLEGATVYRPEGTGSALPEMQFQSIPSNYQETAAVAGMVQWSCDFTVSGAVTSTSQS